MVNRSVHSDQVSTKDSGRQNAIGIGRQRKGSPLKRAAGRGLLACIPSRERLVYIVACGGGKAAEAACIERE